jgi:phospholipid/cholesterol/gamma-HCH transport system permease protein
VDRGVRRDINPLWFMGAAIRSAVRFPRGAWSFAIRVTLNQIRFTTVQALPILILVSGLIVVPMYLSVIPIASDLGVSDVVDRILVVLFVQELGTIIPALLVVARSGTAVAAELATARITGERDALEALGVDTMQYYILPRMVAFAVSIAAMALFFNAVVLGAMALAEARTGELSAFLVLLETSVSSADVWLTVVKGAIVGVGVAALCSMEGIEAGDNPIYIPIAVSRGTMQAFLWVFGASAAFAGIRYLW